MIESFRETDIDPFLALAKEEGWLCDPWEFRFLLRNFPQGCLAYRDQEKAWGYITSIQYGCSGWIGNLLVRPEARKRGIGKSLMEETVTVLLKNGVETVWLTASGQGAELYRRLGFMAVDDIYRWSGRGLTEGSMAAVSTDFELVREVDRRGWGGRRDALLRASCERGRLYTSSGGFVCCQEWESGTQIGPCGCVIPIQAGPLLDQALAGVKGRVILDVPTGNYLATALLRERGFEVTGSTLLMYLGRHPEYRPDYIFALGSMGSMG